MLSVVTCSLFVLTLAVSAVHDCACCCAGIELLLRSRVLGVTEQSVKVADKEGREADIPFGACVWSTGIGMHPLVKQLKAAFPAEQTHNR
jgi:NADH dehydrogenase FAD-containing subunit